MLGTSFTPWEEPSFAASSLKDAVAGWQKLTSLSTTKRFAYASMLCFVPKSISLQQDENGKQVQGSDVVLEANLPHSACKLCSKACCVVRLRATLENTLICSTLLVMWTSTCSQGKRHCHL